MAKYEFKLPDIGEGIAEAEIVAWHVKVGDTIAEDQQIADMMTDKATVEMESPVAGKVVQLAGEVGDQIPIGSVLAVIETEVRRLLPKLRRRRLRKCRWRMGPRCRRRLRKRRFRLSPCKSRRSLAAIEFCDRAGHRRSFCGHWLCIRDPRWPHHKSHGTTWRPGSGKAHSGTNDPNPGNAESIKDLFHCKRGVAPTRHDFYGHCPLPLRRIKTRWMNHRVLI